MRSVIRYLGLAIVAVALAISLVATHAMAFVSGLPTFTPPTQWTVVSSVSASYSYGTSNLQSSVTLTLPGNMFLGPYSDGYYTAAFNVTVTLYNGGPLSGEADLSISCPSPLGSQTISSISIAAGATVTETFTFTSSTPIEVYPSGTITCTISETLVSGVSNANITSVSLSLPIPIAAWGADAYSGQVYPAFTVSFIVPSIGGNNPSVSITPFGGLSIKSTLFVPALGTTGSDTSSFSFGTLAAGSSVSYEFIIISEPWYGYTTNTVPILVTPVPLSSLNWVYAPALSSQSLTFIGASTSNAPLPQAWYVLGGLTLIFNETKGLYVVTNAPYTTGTVSLIGASTTVSVPDYVLTPTNGSATYVYAFIIKPDVSGSYLPIPYIIYTTPYFITTMPPMSTKAEVWEGLTTQLSSVPGLSTSLALKSVSGNDYILQASVGTPLYSQVGTIYVKLSELMTEEQSSTGFSPYVPSVLGKITNSSQYPGFGGYFTFNNYVYVVNVVARGNTTSPTSYLAKATISTYPWPPVVYFNETSMSFTALLNMTLFNITASNTEYWLAVAPYSYGVATWSSSGYTWVVGGDTGVSVSVSQATQHALSLTYTVPSGVGGMALYAWPEGSVNSTVGVWSHGSFTVTGTSTMPIYTSGRLFQLYESAGSLAVVMNYIATVTAAYNGQPVPNVLVIPMNFNSTLTPAQYVYTGPNGVVRLAYYPAGIPAEVEYKSVNGTIVYSATLSGEDPYITLELPIQPLTSAPPPSPPTMPSVVGVSVTPSYISVAPGKSFTVNVLLTLSTAPTVSVTYTGSVKLANYVGSFTITVPAGSLTASTTLTLVAPTQPGIYVGYIQIGNQTASFTVAVTSFVVTTETVIIFAIVIVAVALIYLLWRRRRGGGTVVIRI